MTAKKEDKRITYEEAYKQLLAEAEERKEPILNGFAQLGCIGEQASNKEE